MVKEAYSYEHTRALSKRLPGRASARPPLEAPPVLAPRALQAGVQVAHRGTDAIVRSVTQVLHKADLAPDYVEVRGADLSADPNTGEARLLVAVPVEGVRLIDNTAVNLGEHA